jgi:hypothetical protein
MRIAQALPDCSLEFFAAEPQLVLLVACAVYDGRAALVHVSAAWPLQAAELQAPLCGIAAAGEGGHIASAAEPLIYRIHSVI